MHIIKRLHNILKTETVVVYAGCFWWIAFQCYHDTSQVTDELVQAILLPGLELGAADVFLEFICYSEGPLPEELLPQVKVISQTDPFMFLVLFHLTIYCFQLLKYSSLVTFFLFIVSCFGCVGWERSMGTDWTWKSLWKFWNCWRLRCFTWCWPLPSGFSLSLSNSHVHAQI